MLCCREEQPEDLVAVMMVDSWRCLLENFSKMKKFSKLIKNIQNG